MKSDPVKTVKKGLLTEDPDRAGVNCIKDCQHCQEMSQRYLMITWQGIHG